MDEDTDVRSELQGMAFWDLLKVGWGLGWGIGLAFIALSVLAWLLLAMFVAAAFSG